jgi:hypothetical protein
MEPLAVLLQKYLDAKPLRYPIPSWMGEFLRLKIGKSKLVSLLKKITKDSKIIGLELVDMLKVVQAANADSETFDDFNYEELAVYADSVDKIKARKENVKDLNKLILAASNSIVEICEAIFRAAAYMMCSQSVDESEDDMESKVSLNSEGSSKFLALQRQVTATDSRISDLSSAVEKLTEIIASSLMLGNDSSKTSSASPSRKQIAKIEAPVRKPKSFPGISDMGKKTAVHADFIHEKRAVNISSSEALKKLIGFDSKGSSFMNIVDEPLTFND